MGTPQLTEGAAVRPHLQSTVQIAAVLGALALAVIAVAWLLVPPAGLSLMNGALAWCSWGIASAILALIAMETFELMELVLAPVIEEEAPSGPLASRPMVSVHVAICSEPPDVVRRTLLALRALEYEAIEVLVIDNNTHDERLWRPVEDLCRELGPRFRFFHLPSWPGYKAGALNFALTQTSADAVIVGVIDSDYEVMPSFVIDLIGYFADDRVGFVQAPQNYRGWEGDYRGRSFYWEYWQFFAVSMRLRRQRNAILMHGTMVLIRRVALERAGGWAEWCLTEDSELGLRLLARGYRGVYSAVTYGRGLVPFTVRSYLRQRHRWVTGGVQILIHHWRLFLPWSTMLSPAQKAHYLQGWAPWMRDSLVVTSLPIVILLSLTSLAQGHPSEALMPLAFTASLLLVYLALRQLAVYVVYLRRPFTDAAAATHAIVGMVCTVGVAWLRGCTGARTAFQRTPKEPQRTGDSTKRVAMPLTAGLTLVLLAAAMMVQLGKDGLMAAAGLAAYATVCLAWSAAEMLD